MYYYWLVWMYKKNRVFLYDDGEKFFKDLYKSLKNIMHSDFDLFVFELKKVWNLLKKYGIKLADEKADPRHYDDRLKFKYTKIPMLKILYDDGFSELRFHYRQVEIRVFLLYITCTDEDRFIIFNGDVKKSKDIVRLNHKKLKSKIRETLKANGGNYGEEL